METLAKQIEERMRDEWSMIREEDLERVWPINEEDREEKIAQFAKKYGFRLRHYVKGICAIFDKWPSGGAQRRCASCSEPLMTLGRGKLPAGLFPSPRRGASGGNSTRRQY